MGELERRARKTYGKSFASLPAEQQTALMEQVQSSRAFQHLVGQVAADYYNRREVWAALGYGGAVNDHLHWNEGYLHTGYDRLDW